MMMHLCLLMHTYFQLLIQILLFDTINDSEIPHRVNQKFHLFFHVCFQKLFQEHSNLIEIRFGNLLLYHTLNKILFRREYYNVIRLGTYVFSDSDLVFHSFVLHPSADIHGNRILDMMIFTSVF